MPRKFRRKHRDFSHHLKYAGVVQLKQPEPATESGGGDQVVLEMRYVKRELVKVFIIMMFFALLFYMLYLFVSKTSVLNGVIQSLKIG